MSLLILSHLPATDPSFYHVFKALGENVQECMRDGGCEAAHVTHVDDVHTLADRDGMQARTLLLLGREALQSALGLTDAPAVMGATWTAAEARAIAGVGKAGSLLERLPSLHSVYACMHPADARWARWALPTIQRIIRRAKDRIEPLGDRLAGMSINLSPTLTQLEEALYAGPLVSLDVETPRSDASRILLVGCAPHAGRAVVCEWREPYQRSISNFLGEPANAVVGHNFYYDHGAFTANSCVVRCRVYDTITAEARLYPPQAERKQESDPEAGKKRFKIKWHSLQNSVLRAWDGEMPWKRVEELDWVRAAYGVAFPGYSALEWNHLYCALDVLKTRRLIEYQRERMEGL